MLTFKQFLIENQEFTHWMTGGDAHRGGHITRAQFKAIGKHPNSIYIHDGKHDPHYSVEKGDWHVKHIKIHNPGTDIETHWKISRKGKYYGHTVYRHHPADERHQHGYMSIITHHDIG